MRTDTWPTRRPDPTAARAPRRPVGHDRDVIPGTSGFARVAAETAEWLSERVLEGGGAAASVVAARLRLQARSYREAMR